MSTEKNLVWSQPWNLRAPICAITKTLYYVGNRDVSCHLLRTASGLVLFDTAFSQTTYLLTESLRSLGVAPADIGLVLHSHGHVDHCGATRRIKELSGATVALGEQDIETVERGGPLTCAEYMYGMPDFETFKVDRPLRHGDNFDMGDTIIRCHHTPGHTPGVMTYTFAVDVEGQSLTVGLFGGPGLWTMQDEHRVDQGYPGNRTNFGNSLAYLKTLSVDIWLGAHPNQNDTFGKHERSLAGQQTNPYVDPEGWHRYLEGIEVAFSAMCA